VLSNPKKRAEYDTYGVIDEHDDEFNDFLNSFDFAKYAGMFFADVKLTYLQFKLHFNSDGTGFAI
jgi:DnaJ-class molecular chaperone